MLAAVSIVSAVVTAIPAPAAGALAVPSTLIPSPASAAASPAAPSAAAAAVPPQATLLFGPSDVSGEPGPQSETTIAVDPQNPLVIVAGANDLAGASVAAWSTQDGGKTWKRVEMPLNDAAGELGDSGTDPALAVGPNGTFYYSYTLVSADGNSASVVVSASTDGGRGWTQPAVVIPGLSQQLDNDKDMLAVDNWNDPHRGYLYDVWDQNEPPGKWPTQQIMLAYSPPGGRHWSKPLALNIGYGSGEGIYAQVAVQPDGAIYVLWDDYGQSNEQSVLVGRRCAWSGGALACGPVTAVARSNVNINGPGPARGNPVDCASEQTNTGPGNPPNDGWDCYAIPPQPARGIAAAPALCAGPNGQLNLVYDTATSPGAPNTEVFYTSSRNGGATWSTPMEIDGDAGTAYDFFPWIGCDPVTGALAVSYYSTRGDAAGHRVQEFLTWSLDGGASWTPPQQVSRVASNESVSAADSNDYGDYEGLALLRDVAYPVWTGYGGSPARREQVFAAAAPVPVPPPAPAGLTVIPASPSAQELTWRPSPGAMSYNVYTLPVPGIAAPPGVTPPTLAPAPGSGGAGPVLVASGVTEPRYTYRGVPVQGGPALVIRAVDAAGVGPGTAAFVLPRPSIPAPPGGVVAVSTSSSTVRLTWTPVPQAATYAVTWGGLPWRDGLRAASLTVRGLRPATAYTFRVRAVNALGPGAASGPISAVTAPLPPTGLRASVLPGGGGVRLHWTGSRGASSYLVLRSRSGPRGPFALIAITSASAFTDRVAGATASFWYVVRAVDGRSAPSAPSAPARVVVPPARRPPQAPRGT